MERIRAIEHAVIRRDRAAGAGDVRIHDGGVAARAFLNIVATRAGEGEIHRASAAEGFLQHLAVHHDRIANAVILGIVHGELEGVFRLRQSGAPRQALAHPDDRRRIVFEGGRRRVERVQGEDEREGFFRARGNGIAIARLLRTVYEHAGRPAGQIPRGNAGFRDGIGAGGQAG